MNGWMDELLHDPEFKSSFDAYSAPKSFFFYFKMCFSFELFNVINGVINVNVLYILYIHIIHVIIG